MTYRPPRERGGPNWVGITFLLAALLVALVGLSIVVGGLLPGGASDGSILASVPPRSSTPAASPSDEPSGGATASAPPASAASSSPSAPSPSVPPSPTAASSPSATAPSSSGSPPPAAGAAACSGSDDNRTFFEQAGEALPIDVYCARLPSGWFVVRGSYRGAGGGFLEIQYRGPGGATFRLREGDACAGDPACPPAGDVVGPASFGDRSGELRRTADGFAIVAGSGSPLYLAEFTGVDQATATSLGAALVRVAAP